MPYAREYIAPPPYPWIKRATTRRGMDGARAASTGSDQEIAGVQEEWPCGAMAIGVRTTRRNRNDSGEHVSAEHKTVELDAADVADCARKNGGDKKSLQSRGHLHQAEPGGRGEKALADEVAPSRRGWLGGAIYRQC